MRVSDFLSRAQRERERTVYKSLMEEANRFYRKYGRVDRQRAVFEVPRPPKP